MLLNIKVKTNSTLSQIQINNNKYFAYLKNQAIKNKANFELIDLLADYFETGKNNISIIRGSKSKNKVILIKKSDINHKKNSQLNLKLKY